MPAAHICCIFPPEEILKRLLAQHAPEKLANVPKLLARFVGRERELVRRVQAKYEPASKEEGGRRAH